MSKLASLLWGLIKVGFIGFGGGSALIPIIGEEVVAKRKLISQARYDDDIIIANITPGALPVKLAAAVGFQTAGIGGMLAAAVAVSFPGVLLMLVIIALVTGSSTGAVLQIENAAAGIGVFIIFLLMQYIEKVMRGARREQYGGRALLVMAVVFLLTCGKEVNQLLGTAFPWPDVSVIDILLCAFMVILLSGVKIAPTADAALGVLYLAAAADLLPAQIRWFILALALALLLLAGQRSRAGARREKKNSAPAWPGLLRQLAAWLGFGLAFSLPALVKASGALAYLGQGAASTVMSFGGGEAYLTVADSMFVASGQVIGGIFYGQLLPVANALPGPILCKLLAAIGYVLGSAEAASWGWLWALAGWGVAMAASCGAFSLIGYVYHCYDHLPIFTALRQWVLPIVCGLLLTTILAMLVEDLHLAAARHWSAAAALLLLGAVYGLLWWLHRCFKIHDLLLIILAGAITLAAWNLRAGI